MIRKLSYVNGRGFDPYYNLAVEEFLTESVEEDEITLYLWQNQNTVVFGKNQNPWRECKVAELKAAGGIAVRRMSGGGAVFHDLGNLNFTFSVRDENYDLKKQQKVLLWAVKSLGIEAELSGRNDLTANGCKFSGNSFYSHLGRSFHNGTLLVDVDMEGLGRFLTPSKAKLKAKAVDSVRSRVINLKELRPDLDIEMMRRAILEAFGAVYGLKPEEKHFSKEDEARILELRAKFSSDQWNFGEGRAFDVSFGDKYPWGEISIELAVEAGSVKDAKVYTDSLDTGFAEPLGQAFIGAEFSSAGLIESLKASPEPGEDIKADLIKLIKEQSF